MQRALATRRALVEADPGDLLAAEGATIFMSTHTLKVAEDICDRIGVIHRGRLVASGTTPKMLTRESYARPVGYGAMCLESLVAIMAMVAAYTNRNLIYEQRVSVNNYRATAAMSAAMWKHWAR